MSNAAHPPEPQPPEPLATYRFQLTPTFGFAAAAERFASLARLGVSHAYLSPVAEAVTGSTHGYDVVDHRTVREALGGEAGLVDLLDTAAATGLGVIVDHVPNHVSVTRPELNPRWWELLRTGRSGPAARWFDVDWELTGDRVIVPRLGDELDRILERGELELVGAAELADLDLDPTIAPDGVVRHHDLLLPIAPGTAGGPVADVLGRQHYDLRWWRSPERNVRRFFTIDDLIGVRVEDPEVAAIVDTIPRLLAGHPAFAGVRVDHVDGLAEPGRYLDGLRSAIGEHRLLYVEKILGPGETLPAHWPVDGTTGYEHITFSEHTLLDPDGAGPILDQWGRGGGPADFHVVEHTARLEVLDDGLAPDLERLLRAVRAAAPGGDDPDRLRAAVVAITVALDRYRTYLPDDPVSADVLDRAIEDAERSTRGLAEAIGTVAAALRHVAPVTRRWQQLTGPVMAKGAEDRAFYRYTPLAALAEVGGSPGRWTFAVDEFHAHQQLALAWPRTLLASSTHDTKRSDAVRARSLALAARATAWTRTVDAWLDVHEAEVAALRTTDVVLALQTAVTAQPLDPERLGEYLVKAAREAEVATTWTDPDDDYETALRDLAAEICTEVAHRPDGDGSLHRWAALLGGEGGVAGLRLLALQLTAPGVPDLYQGAPGELATLVDPDNRRTPAWDRWADLVDAHVAGDVRQLAADGAFDEARTALTGRILGLRRRRSAAFGAEGGYRPVVVDDDTVAFTRLDADADPAVLVVVRRVLSSDTPATPFELPVGTWRDALTEGVEPIADTIALDDLVGPLGLAVLERTTP